MKKFYIQVILIVVGLFLAVYPLASAEAFSHPGLLNNQAELDLIREKVNAGQQPWLDGYGELDGWFEDLKNRGYPLTSGTGVNRYANYKPLVLGYTMQNGEVRPSVTVFCDDGANGYTQELMWDARAAYASALHWVVDQDEIYAKKAVEIINNWASTVSRVTYYCEKRLDASKNPITCTSSAECSSLNSGDQCVAGTCRKYNNHTRLLIAGSLQQLVYAAEIMRATYSDKWNPLDQIKFGAFLRDKMYSNMVASNRTGEECVNNGSNHNWGIMAAETRMAIAIFNDNNAQFNEAVLDYKFYIEKSFKPFGKYLETCRLGNESGSIGCDRTIGGDLDHTQMTLQALTAMAEMAKKQGVDLYGYTDTNGTIDPSDDNSLLTTLKYHAPFMGFGRAGSSSLNWPCEKALVDSGTNRKKSFWEMGQNHYQDPVLKSLVEEWGRPEGNLGWSDVGWGTLTHNYAGALFLFQDVNEDTKINIKDIQECIRAIIAPPGNLRADVNRDEKANIKDIQAIIHCILNPQCSNPSA